MKFCLKRRLGAFAILAQNLYPQETSVYHKCKSRGHNCQLLDLKVRYTLRKLLNYQVQNSKCSPLKLRTGRRKRNCLLSSIPLPFLRNFRCSQDQKYSYTSHLGHDRSIGTLFLIISLLELQLF